MSVNKVWGRYVECLWVKSKNNENVRINLKTELILLPVSINNKKKAKEQRHNEENYETAAERKEERLY